MRHTCLVNKSEPIEVALDMQHAIIVDYSVPSFQFFGSRLPCISLGESVKGAVAISLLVAVSIPNHWTLYPIDR